MISNPALSTILNFFRKSPSQEPPFILAIDDSPSSCILFRRAAEKMQLDITLCTSATEARQCLKSKLRYPGLILLNILMPDQDGASFLRMLRKLPRYRETPVIIVSSKDYAQDRAVAKSLGALTFITKPFTIKEVCKAIKEALRHTQSS